MYPILPAESMTGAVEMLCYFFTLMITAAGFMFTRNG